MELPPPRIVTLVLVDAVGAVLGALPPFEAETPWWNDVGPVVRAVRSRHGVVVTLLRLLSAERSEAPGGAVSYVAQLHGGTAPEGLQAWHGVLPDDPKRHAYARVGGPESDLAWAQAVLHARGDALVAAPQQIRTWNLSSLWCLPTHAGRAWLKVVPPFFAHEGNILRALSAAPVPRLLGHDGGRVLLADIPGDDCYEAALPARLAMIDLLVDLQAAWLGRAPELLVLGLPDWRAPALSVAIAALVERRAGELELHDRAALAALVAGLPKRFAAIAACGMVEGLVHGDFHPGNVRGNAASLTLLDWSDSGIGHPLLDQPAFLSRSPPGEIERSRAHWSAAWRHHLPGADPERAAQLLAPVAAARQALIYQRFLDGIEAAEHPYHRSDVPHWLHRTADLLRGESAG